MPTEDAYSSGHLVLSLSELAFILLFDTSDTPYRLDIIPVCDIITGLDIYTDSDISPNIGFHRASATGVACRQGTLTSPDTWSCPTLGLASVRSYVETNLSWTCVVSGLLSFEHPSVLLFLLLVDNLFMVFAGKFFQQIVGIPMGTNCAPLLADTFLYLYEAEFIQSLLSTGRKYLASQFDFTYRYIDDVWSRKNPEFENNLGQMYPVELRSKTRQRVPLMLHTWIYFCRSVGTVNFILQFMTNMTISISILHIFCSWVAIYQLRPPPPMALSNSLNDMPGFASRMNVLFWGRQDFQISFWKRDMSRNAWNRHWRSFFGRYGDIKQYEVPLSRMLNDILKPGQIQWHPSIDETSYRSDHPGPFNRTQPVTDLWEVSIEHLRRV